MNSFMPKVLYLTFGMRTMFQSRIEAPLSRIEIPLSLVDAE